MNLIHIGEYFYRESGGAMSPIHHKGSFKRADWSVVQKTLQAGEEVHIYPANLEELGMAQKMLMEIKNREEKRR